MLKNAEEIAALDYLLINFGLWFYKQYSKWAGNRKWLQLIWWTCWGNELRVGACPARNNKIKRMRDDCRRKCFGARKVLVARPLKYAFLSQHLYLAVFPHWSVDLLIHSRCIDTGKWLMQSILFLSRPKWQTLFFLNASIKALFKRLFHRRLTIS